jgi:predicted HTH domain antitoxin
MQTFNLRQLGERSADLAREAKAGHLSLITEQDQPLCVSVPFDEQMLQTGVHVAMAVRLFESGAMTPGRAARLAGMTYPEFLEHVSGLGIPVVDYDPAELEQELKVLDGP